MGTKRVFARKPVHIASTAESLPVLGHHPNDRIQLRRPPLPTQRVVAVEYLTKLSNHCRNLLGILNRIFAAPFECLRSLRAVPGHLPLELPVVTFCLSLFGTGCTSNSVL